MVQAKRFNGLVAPAQSRPLPRDLATGDPALATLEKLGQAFPDRLEYIIFPESGGFEPLPAGVTTIDLVNGRVTAPDGLDRPLSAEYRVLDKLQSLIFLVDSVVTVRVEPGVGRFIADASTPVFGAGRHVERLHIEASFPYSLTVLLGTSQWPAWINAYAKEVYRWSDTTLTKAAAASVADSWTAMRFTPRYALKTLNQARWGVQEVYYADVGQKLFLVRNLSAVAAEVRVRGAINVYVAGAINALGLTAMDYVPDPDIHQAGTPQASYVTVEASSYVVLETNLPWQMLQVEGRVPAAQANGAQARLVTEIEGISYAIR